VYNLTDQEITEGFEYIIGLRKYNGEYSYPKNAGLLSGIIWDIIILSLLLVKRSLLKTKGIWNFININDEFTKVPIFEQNNDNIDIISNPQNSKPESFFYIFIKRLVPELFNDGKKIIYKPGIDLYPFSFASLLVILIYTICFFGSMTCKYNVTITDVLDRQQFSKELVLTILFITSIIVADRMIYKWRSVKSDFLFELFRKEVKGRERRSKTSYGSDDDVNTSNRALIIKLLLHYFLLVIVHLIVFIAIPFSTHICFYNNNSLIIFYVFCIVYFYISALQIKYGFPMITKGQYFTAY
jgi:hypothetical protein